MAAQDAECAPLDSHRQFASDYAAQLLAPFVQRRGRVSRVLPPARAQRHPALEWARSGAMALTGPRHGAPRLAPGHLATCCHAAGLALGELSLTSWPDDFDAPALLGERAAIAGLERQGATAPGGSCRFVRCADAWLAVNLARPDDRACLPAWLAESSWQGDWPRELSGQLSGELSDDIWHRVSRAARSCKADSLVAGGRLLGLAVAREHNRDGQTVPRDAEWCRTLRCGKARQRRPAERPLVVDLSSLWAGPLCSHLLSLAGARVIKIESLSRPDGARAGPSAFFDLMNAGKQSVALDFSNPVDLRRLRALLCSADIVVESARPRGLRQLGIEAEECLRETPGQVWVAITGYGRRPPEEHWIAFGDDAAVAAGLTLRDVSMGLAGASNSTGAANSPDEANPTGSPSAAPPLFCGDAIADPLTGLHAAVAALASWRSGGGVLLDLQLRGVVSHALASGPMPRPAVVRAEANPTPHGEATAADALWQVVTDDDRQSVLPPRARTAPRRARSLGADTDSVLCEFGAT